MLLDFGAIVQMMPVKDSLLRISQIANERGRLKLSVKAADPVEGAAQ